MTNYRRADESQRNDLELREAIRKELIVNYVRIARAKQLLEAAYDVLNEAVIVEDDSMSSSSGMKEARFQTKLAINRFGHKLKEEPTEAYIGNVAAFMSPEQVQTLKRKHGIN